MNVIVVIIIIEFDENTQPQMIFSFVMKQVMDV